MSDRLFVATRKGLFEIHRKDSSSQPWQINRVFFLGDPVSMLLPDKRDGSIYAALNLGHFGVKVHRSRDGGESWQECAVPVYPKPSAGDDEEGAPEWNLKQIWSLEAGGANEEGKIWAGTTPGGLFCSQDYGDSWELNRSLWQRPERKEWFGGGADQPSIHSICVDPKNSQQLSVGISCGGVWVTIDGGENWECRSKGMYAAYMPPDRRNDPNIQDPHRVVQCASEPASFWLQHHNGIFRSTDYACSWQEITEVKPSNFGFAVAVHPANPQTAWFVPAVKDECRVPVDGKMVVTRTRDGGKSFEILRTGLPQHYAYDLVYRHGLDIAANGECLAIGSTTGGLWITDNQGDNWHCVSVNLPPIYAVRFG